MFQKKDFLLIVAIILIVIVSALIILPAWKGKGEDIRITIEGTLYGEYSLSKNQTITVDELLGYNKIIIENGIAYMNEADCPDQYCIQYKPIKNGGETIICLPHKLVVEVIGEQHTQQIDVIVP